MRPFPVAGSTAEKQGSCGSTGPSQALLQAFARRRDWWNVRILIIEDEPKIARSLVQGLEAEHFTVDLAEDGENGLRLATETRYDGIVLDWNLPRLDGLTLLRKLRQVWIQFARADSERPPRGR